MTTITELWASKSATGDQAFKASAKYLPAMDCLIYLREDCSYRAVRLNPKTTVLLHPYEDRPVGVKFKGVRQTYLRLGSLLRAMGIKSTQAINLVAFWELSYDEDGEDHIEIADRERQKMWARRAREVLESAGPLDSTETNAMATEVRALAA